MTLSYKARRRWSLVILLIGMPLYVILAVNIIDRMERPGLLLELLIYVALGIAWIIPFKFVFKGIGQPDPDAPADDGSR
jgi:hypothetical protein